MPDDLFRELTPEEADAAWATAEPEPLSGERITEIVRFVMLADGKLPLTEASQAEVDAVFRWAVRQASARDSTA